MVVGFIPVRALVHSGANIRRRVVWRDEGSLGFAWVHSGALSGCRIHKGSRGFTHACLGVVGFIRVRVGTLRRALRL